jgi:hypothetical protein
VTLSELSEIKLLVCSNWVANSMLDFECPVFFDDILFVSSGIELDIAIRLSSRKTILELWLES